MAIASLTNVITGGFIKGLSATNSASSSKTVQASSSKESVNVTLRSGAANISKGLQALNVGITFVNLSRSTHEQLLSVVDKLDVLVSKAAKSGASGQAATTIQLEFQSLNKEFQKIIKSSKVQGNDTLDVDALSAILVKGGLDPDKSDELGAAFKKVTTLSKTNTDGAVVNSPSTLLPVDEFGAAVRRATSVFAEASQAAADGTGAEGIDPLTLFVSVRDKLKGIRTQLRENVKALDQAVETIGKNISLARAAGFALLALSESAKADDDPEIIAASIRDRIRADAPQALSQATNLQSIVVAGLTLTPGAFKSVLK